MMNEQIKIIYDLTNSKRYHQALALVDRELMSSRNNPVLLLLKAELMQLDTEMTHDLNDICKILQTSIDYSNESVEALLEMAWFQFNVLDDAKRALKYFELAKKKADTFSIDIDKGIQECRNELYNDG